jgi:hypothetical protein
MRYLFGFVCVCALGLMPLVGCSDGSGGTAGTGGTAGSGGADTTSIAGVITGWDPLQGPLGPLEGVEICETDTDNCALTDAAGSVTVQVPTDQETSVTMAKEGFAKYLLPVVVSAEVVPIPFSMATEQRIEDMHGLVMSPYPMEGTGDVVIGVTAGSAFAGATFDLGDAAGQVFYYDDQGNWDADLTSTGTYGGGPWGGFTEVSPGVVQVEIGGTATSCERLSVSGWPGDVANSVRMPIREGYQSQVQVACDAP